MLNMQAIVTKHLPATATKGRRIKATCSTGSIIVSLSKLDGDNGQPAIEGNIDRHRAVAKMLQARYGWNWPLQTGLLPNGDYVHVQLNVRAPFEEITREGRTILINGKPAFHLERAAERYTNRSAATPVQADEIAQQLYQAIKTGYIRVREHAPRFFEGA